MRRRWSLGIVATLLLGCTGGAPPPSPSAPVDGAASSVPAVSTMPPPTERPTDGPTGRPHGTPLETPRPPSRVVGEDDLGRCSRPLGDGPAVTVELRPLLAADGSVAAHRLRVPMRDAWLVVELSDAAFAASSPGGVVVYGDDDGEQSRVRVVDADGGCLVATARREAIVRSALVEAASGSLYEHRLARSTRTDRGVFHSDLADPGDARRVLGPIAPDARVGPTFVTTLLSGPDAELVVQSCGEAACRTRILDVADGSVVLLDAPGQGPIIEVLRDALLVESPGCDAPPCPRWLVDRATGAIRPAED
jgi:hypothetical protein